MRAAALRRPLPFSFLSLRAPPLRSASSSSSTAAASSSSPSRPQRVLVTGAGGQIGVELVASLRARYGSEAVLATDVRSTPALRGAGGGGPFRFLDTTSVADVSRALVEHDASTVVHLASLLSAVGERAPARAIVVNARGSEAVLAAAAEHGAAVFAPSTIAVFGAGTPRDATPNETVLRPTTIYGVTKVYTELLGEYYARKFGVDFRSLRYPGIISHLAPAGGGTTDYAVDIFYAALRDGRYSCFLRPDTALPMMYMPDCLRSTLELIDAPAAALARARVFNITALSFTPAELAAAITRYVPHFQITYRPDERQAIADSWPRSIDDGLAREQWGWRHRYDLDAMTRDMLRKLALRLKLTVPPALVNDKDLD